MCEIPHTVQSGFQKIEATIAVESPIAACRERPCSEAHSRQLRRPSLPGPSACALSHTRILGLFSLLSASELEVAPATGTEASFGLFILNGETESRGDEGPYSRARPFPSGTQLLSATLLLPHCQPPFSPKEQGVSDGCGAALWWGPYLSMCAQARGRS